MRRILLILTVLALLALAACSMRFDGQVRATRAQLSVRIEGSNAWYTRPPLASSVDDPQAIYAIVPALPSDGRFAAVRVDTRTGAQTRTFVPLGYGTSYRALDPARDVTIDVRGLRWNRPAFHLMTLPDGKGPGFRMVDSATGEMRVVLRNGQPRELLSRLVFNSTSAAELLSQVFEDQHGHSVAALTRDDGGWMLHLFSRRATNRRALIALEEL